MLGSLDDLKAGSWVWGFFGKKLALCTLITPWLEFLVPPINCLLEKSVFLAMKAMSMVCVARQRFSLGFLACAVACCLTPT